MCVGALWNLKLMIYVRSLLFNVLFPIIVLINSTFAVIAGVTFGRSGVLWVARFNGHAVNFFLYILCNIKIEVRGYENIPDQDCYLVACKHQSTWETMYILNLIKNPIVIMKRELMYIPIFGQVVTLAGSIMINRKKGRSSITELIEGAKKSFAKNQSIFIFPEGTRSSPGQAGHYRYGIAAIYENCHVPVVPIALNSGYFWPRRGFLKYPGTIKVEILPPIAAGLNGKVLLKKLEKTIESASQKLAP